MHLVGRVFETPVLGHVLHNTERFVQIFEKQLSKSEPEIIRFVMVDFAWGRQILYRPKFVQLVFRYWNWILKSTDLFIKS